jgi:hypothetical protein
MSADKSEHILILNQRLQIADDAAEGIYINPIGHY